MCSFVVGLGSLLFALANIAILYQIGGQSDGPGALFFYLGAGLGLLVAWACLGSRSSPSSD